MYYIYNNLPKNKSISRIYPNIDNVLTYLSNSTKTPLKKVKDIKSVETIGEKGFFIEYKGKGNCGKKDTYEVNDVSERDEIIGKLNILTVICA